MYRYSDKSGVTVAMAIPRVAIGKNLTINFILRMCVLVYAWYMHVRQDLRLDKYVLFKKRSILVLGGVKVAKICIQSCYYVWYLLRIERMDDESSDSGTEVDPRPSSHIRTITGKYIVVS